MRYADDTLLGFIGTKQEAEALKKELGNMLNSIKLEMSQEKTLITNARKGKARFLNYEIGRRTEHTQKTKCWNGRRMCQRRSVNSSLYFSMPDDVFNKWADKVSPKGKPEHRRELMNLSDYDMISTYEVELQGLINYYNRSHNQERLRYLRYLWKTSLIKTLAAKYKTRAMTILKRYMKYTPDGKKVIGVEIQRKGKKPLRAVFGRKPSTREKFAIIKDNVQTVFIVRNELITRLLATKCELCEKENTTLVGHHVKKLKDLWKRWKGKEKPAWVKRMIAIKRKSLFICPECHNKIHSGTYDGKKIT